MIRTQEDLQLYLDWFRVLYPLQEVAVCIVCEQLCPEPRHTRPSPQEWILFPLVDGTAVYLPDGSRLELTARDPGHGHWPALCPSCCRAHYATGTAPILGCDTCCAVWFPRALAVRHREGVAVGSYMCPRCAGLEEASWLRAPDSIHAAEDPQKGES